MDILNGRLYKPLVISIGVLFVFILVLEQK